MADSKPTEDSRTKQQETDRGQFSRSTAVTGKAALSQRIQLGWRMSAWILGSFLLLVGITLILSDARIRRDDPLKSAKLKEQIANLRRNPADEKLKAEIRQLDLELRGRYFRHLSRKESGVYLLLGGSALFVLAMARLGNLKRQLPRPGPKPDASVLEIRTALMSRWLVAGSGGVIAMFLLVSTITLTTALPRQTAQIEKLLGSAPETAVGDSASVDKLKQNWPRFRGPDANGIALFTNAPLMWDGKTGAGIVWKIPTPASGYNSPIVWRNRVFFSGASDSERTVFCLDAGTGQMLWHESVGSAAGAAKTKPEGAASASYANSTMTTDGQRVYAFFGNGDLAAFTLDGKPAWSKGLGPVKNDYGHAASLTMWREKLILQLDQGDPEQGKSKLYALDGRTGQILWQRPRKVGSSWATPLVIEAAGKAQIITLAVPWVIAYAVTDGAELWRVEGLNGEITPSPIFSAGLVLVTSPSEKLLAIRPDGSGDVTKTHVVWTTEENVPDITSPVCDGELLFTLTTPGMLTCFEPKEGKKQWEHDFETEFHCSPSIAAGRVYLLSLKGTAIVVEAGRQFKELFRAEMGDVFAASPAFAEHRIFLRGETNVWCLGPVEAKIAKKE